MSRKKILIIISLIILLAFTGFIITESVLRKAPKIHSISKYLCLPGEKIVIEGQGFGDRQGSSILYFGDREIKSSHIELWEDWTIRFRVPPFERSAILRVKTNGGESDGILVYHQEQFPQLLSSSFLPGHPYIEYLNPAKGVVGSLVTLKGYDFGSNRGQSRLWINRTPNNFLSYYDVPDLGAFIEPQPQDYVLWENDTIQFYLPDEAQGGFIYIQTPKGFSNPVYLDVLPPAGVWNEMDQRYVMLEQEVLLSRVAAMEDNQFYLWLPKPVDLGNQSKVRVLSSTHQVFVLLPQLDLIRLDELRTAQNRSIRRLLVLESITRQAELSPSDIPSRYFTQRHLYKHYTESWGNYSLEDSTMRSIAVDVTRRSNHPYYRTQLIYNYVKEKLEPLDQAPMDTPLNMVRRGDASSEGYSDITITLLRIMGIPARKVAGIYLGDNSSTPHFWVEVFFENFGWFPLDPFMADQANQRFQAREEAFYWGGEDHRRIAFSKGWIETLSPVDDGLIQEVFNPYSIQEIYEVKRGNLASYHSQWLPPREIVLTSQQ